MFRLDKESVDIVQPAIRRFRHQRTGPTLEDPAVLDLPLDDRIADNADAMRVGDPNRALEKAAFLHPGRAGHFAISVKGKPTCKDRVMLVLTARVDDRYS